MIVHLKVKPSSKIDALFVDATGMLNVKIKAPPQDGKANAYLATFLGKELGVAQSKIEILAGFTNQFKKIAIEIEPKVFETFMEKLRSCLNGSP